MRHKILSLFLSTIITITLLSKIELRVQAKNSVIIEELNYILNTDSNKAIVTEQQKIRNNIISSSSIEHISTLQAPLHQMFY